MKLKKKLLIIAPFKYVRNKNFDAPAVRDIFEMHARWEKFGVGGWWRVDEELVVPISVGSRVSFNLKSQ